MKKLHYLILKSYIGPFLMSFAIILFILVVQFMSLYIDKIAGKGVGAEVLLQLFGYAAGRLALTALPVAILSGALITFGGMGENYELAAIKSSGINLFRLTVPTLYFAMGLTALSMWVSFELIPKANLKFFSLLYDVSRKKPDVALQPGHFYNDIDGYVIRVSNKDRKRGMLYDVLIYDHTAGVSQGTTRVILADSALTQLSPDGNSMNMKLYYGTRHEEYTQEVKRQNRYPYGRTYFDSLYYSFSLKGFDLNRTDEKMFRHQIVMPLQDLYGALDSLKIEKKNRIRRYYNQMSRHNEIDSTFTQYSRDSMPGKRTLVPYDLEGNYILACFPSENYYSSLSNLNSELRSLENHMNFMVVENKDQESVYNRYAYELYIRYFLPINCILFMLLGVSLGAIIRKGGLGMPALVSLILFVVFYILITQGRKFSKEGFMDPGLGAALPVLVFLPLTVYASYQAATDSRLFDESSWAMLQDKVGTGLRAGYARLRAFLAKKK